MFLKNAWYVAAWGHEVTRDLRQIIVLGEKICLFRARDGEVIALEDACPHRKLPLSQGRIKDDTVECGYHGLTFDCAGRCVWAPGGGRIPSAARVRPYPVHEKYGLVWVWMGNAAIADTDDIIDSPNFGDPEWGLNTGAAIVPEAPAAAAPVAAAPAAARSGQDVYNSACLACHMTGAAGAPKTGDAAAWAPRIARGMDTMVSNAINGLNAMPPKGLCMSCSDEDIRGVVEYIVAQSQ